MLIMCIHFMFFFAMHVNKLANTQTGDGLLLFVYAFFIWPNAIEMLLVVTKNHISLDFVPCYVGIFFPTFRLELGLSP